jgi:hypothetical protein
MANKEKDAAEKATFEPVPLVHSDAAETDSSTMDMNKPTEPTTEVAPNAAVAGDAEYVNDAEPRGIATVENDDTYVTDRDYHDPEGFVRGT